jgi:hypothetical protein
MIFKHGIIMSVRRLFSSLKAPWHVVHQKSRVLLETLAVIEINAIFPRFAFHRYFPYKTAAIFNTSERTKRDCFRWLHPCKKFIIFTILFQFEKLTRMLHPIIDMSHNTNYLSKKHQEDSKYYFAFPLNFNGLFCQTHVALCSV